MKLFSSIIGNILVTWSKKIEIVAPVVFGTTPIHPKSIFSQFSTILGNILLTRSKKEFEFLPPSPLVPQNFFAFCTFLFGATI